MFRNTKIRLEAIKVVYIYMSIRSYSLDELLFLHENIQTIEKKKQNRKMIELIQGSILLEKKTETIIKKILNEKTSFKRINILTKAILTVAYYELEKFCSIPTKILLNEYTNIASVFLEKENVNLVNALLEKITLIIRQKK